MRTITSFLSVMLFIAVTGSVSAVTITTFGNVDSPTFTDIGSSFATTQAASSLNIVGTDVNRLSGDVTPVVYALTDVTAGTDLVLTGAIAVAPSSAFTIRLYDGSGFDTIDYVGGSWVDLNTDGSSTLSLFSANASFDATDIIGFDLIANGFGSGVINATLSDLSYVPEPSTYAALAGLCALGYVMVRRRRA